VSRVAFERTICGHLMLTNKVFIVKAMHRPILCMHVIYVGLHCTVGLQYVGYNMHMYSHNHIIAL